MRAALALWLAAAAPTAWPELPVAEGRVGPWRMSAATFVDQSQQPPKIAGMRCSVRRRGFALLLGRDGGAELYFGGDGTGFSLVGVRSVTIGEARWEARLLPLPPAGRYADVDYPAGHPASIGKAEDYLGVRSAEGEPWLHLATLVDELAEGSNLVVEHDLGAYRLSLEGLPRALKWCTSAMQSERARQFRR